jgi:hypothetical protein
MFVHPKIAEDGAAPVAALVPFPGQDKPDHRAGADNAAIVVARGEANDPQARAVADRMRASRPGRDYGGETA